MAKVITGSDALVQARKVCAGKGEVVLAVSYWGKGATNALRIEGGATNIRIVLNVQHGGTNPEELETLMKTLPGRVRVHPTLHSKVFASKEMAMLGSTNASALGLNWDGSGHTEAAVVVKGSDAGDAFELAVEFYKKGRDASIADLKMCRERFGRRPLASLLIANPCSKSRTKNLNPADTFKNRSDIFGSMPIIISDGEADPEVLRKDWSDQSVVSEELPSKAPYDPSVWTYFQWNIDRRYRGKACVELHKAENGSLSLHLVQPIHYEGKEGTFARRLAWPILGHLGQYWDKMVRNIPYNEQLSQVHTELSEDKYLTGWDVYSKLQALSAQ